MSIKMWFVSFFICFYTKKWVCLLKFINSALLHINLSNHFLAIIS